MGNNTWENALDPFPSARGAAKNTFTAYQDISPLQLPSTAGNELRLGSKVELEAYGEYSCATGVTSVHRVHLRRDRGRLRAGVAIGQSGAITTGTTPTAWPWHIKYVGLVTAIGTSGVLYGQGVLDLGTSLTAFAASAAPVTAAARSATIDTTVSKLWGVGAAWGASAAGNTITVDSFTAKIVNQGKTS
jgi:hypothetical protein